MSLVFTGLIESCLIPGKPRALNAFVVGNSLSASAMGYLDLNTNS